MSAMGHTFRDGQPSALHRRRTLLQDNDTLRDGRGVVHTRLRTDWSTSVSTPRRPWTWSTRLRMTPTPSSLTPKSFFKSLISWARAMSASENVNSPADWPGMSHSSRGIESGSRHRPPPGEVALFRVLVPGVEIGMKLFG